MSVFVQIPSSLLSVFDGIIEKFRARWQKEFSHEITEQHFAPAVASAPVTLRRFLLIEMVAIDFMTRWTRGDSPKMQLYFAAHPELANDDPYSLELLMLEYSLNRQRDTQLSPTIYANEYPPHREAILQRLSQLKVKPQLGTLLPNEQTLGIISDGLMPIPIDIPIEDSHNASGSAVQNSGSLSGLQTGRPKSIDSNSGSTEIPFSVESSYKRIRLLGRGNVGEVWLAEAPGGIEVALKIVRFPSISRLSQMELRSLQLMKRLRHPFLLQMQAFWIDEDQITIAMELADLSLRDRVNRFDDNKIPADELLTYMVEAAEGIDFLHREQVVHRDIKPENLMLLKGHIKVADFGLARIADSNSENLKATHVVGSPLYMAPETWEGMPVPKSDQYSLAITYLELRLGRSPFLSEGMASLMKEHLFGEPQMGSLPQREQSVLHQALAKDPADRFETCSEMAQALRSALTPQFETIAPKSKSFSWLVTAIGALALAGGAVGGIVTVNQWKTTGTSSNNPTFDVLLNPTYQSEYGVVHQPIAIESSDTSDPIVEVKWENLPSGIDLDYSAATKQLLISVDPNTQVRSQIIPLQFLSRSGKTVAKEWNLTVRDSRFLRLPTGFSPAKNSKRVLDNDYYRYERIECEKLVGGTLEFRLIPQGAKSGTDGSTIPSFYISTTEVSNRVLIELAKNLPHVLESIRQKNVGLLNATEEPNDQEDWRLPVVNLTASEASNLAAQINGKLPTTLQWDKASGAFSDWQDRVLASESDREFSQEGPFRVAALKSDELTIRVNCPAEGPSPSGSNRDDESVYGVFDMAGNVREFTQNIFLRPHLFVSAAGVQPKDLVELRGKSYFSPLPWHFDDRKTAPDTIEYEDFDSQTGFRIVIE